MTATIVGGADVVAGHHLECVRQANGLVQWQALTESNEGVRREVVVSSVTTVPGSRTLIKAIAGTHVVDREKCSMAETGEGDQPAVSQCTRYRDCATKISRCATTRCIANLYLGREALDSSHVLLAEPSMESEVRFALMQRLAVRIQNVAHAGASVVVGSASQSRSRARVRVTKIVVLDEPTAGFAWCRRAPVLELIRTVPRRRILALS